MNITNLTKLARVFAFVSMFAFSCGLHAQDIHFAQYWNTPLHVSPALTGAFDGDTRFHGSLRDQWYLDQIVPWRTALAAVDTKFFGKKKSTSFFAAGALLNYDHAGDSRMGTLQLSLNGSYTRQMARNHFATIGVQLSGNQRRFNTDDLTWDNQYRGDILDPNSGSGENFISKSKLYGDFSVALNYHFRKKKSRTKLNIGTGLFHINTPNKSFWDETNVNLARKFNWYGMGAIQLADKVDLLAHILGQYQGPHTEHVAGLAGKLHLDERKTREKAVWLGLMYRFNDGLGAGESLIPNIGLNNRAWQFGLSYDITISDGTLLSGGFGGPEFSVIYIIKKAIVEDFCPTCPVYL